MTDDELRLPALAEQVADLVRLVITEVRHSLVDAAVTGEHGEQRNERHSDNFLSRFDVALHRRYRELFTQILPSFVYASEEDEPVVVGDDASPDICVLVDPLDTSELAVRGLNAYTQVLVYSRQLGRPVAAVVGDIFHHVQLYVAGRGDDGSDSAYLVTSDSEVRKLGLAGPVRVADALVTNFFMKPAERFVPLSKQLRLIAALSEPGSDGKSRGRLGVDYGSVGLCHVAAGFTDAMIEFAKGFAIWDLMPGHYVLSAAGGVVVDLEGVPLSFTNRLDSLDGIARSMTGRQRFIAARTPELAAELASLLDR